MKKYKLNKHELREHWNAKSDLFKNQSKNLILVTKQKLGEQQLIYRFYFMKLIFQN